MAIDTLSKVKRALRISHNKLDEDIQDDITACLADLKTCGIAEPKEEDPLILKAIKLYCLGHLTDDVTKSAEYLRLYDHHKGFLMSAKGYGRAEVTAEEVSNE